MSSVSAARSSLGDRYRVLLEIGRKLTGTLAIEDLYRAIYDETAGVLEASGFYISLYDPDSDLARVVFYADKGDVSRCDITYRGSDSDVIRTGTSTMVEDRLDEQSVMLLGEEDTDVTRSAISAPLLVDDAVIGAISTQSYEPHAYTSDDMELLQGIADLAAIAVANASRLGELDKRRREAEQIEEIGRALTSSLNFDDVIHKVARSAMEVADADGAAVWLIEDRVATCRQAVGPIQIPIGCKWPMGEDMYGALVEDADVFEIEDFAECNCVPDSLTELGLLVEGSGIAIPLVVDHLVVGALSCGSTSIRAFSADERRALLRLGSQASIALENARLHEYVQALSLTDPLTGLPNRRHLEMHLMREVAAARRGRPLCLVIFDLDDFKVYNDTLGHLAGDEILQAFAEGLHGENREMNLVARYGGDAFVSVLSESDEEGARGYLDRIRKRLKTADGLAQHDVKVSTGIALFDPDGMDGLEDLFELADRNMYSEKEERR